MTNPPASLAGLLPEEIEKLIAGHKRFRALQIYKWIINGADSFNEMTDIPAAMQKELNERFSLFCSAVETIHDEKEAKKIIIRHFDGLKTEAVLLNDGKKRLTACLSTQTGCPIKCVFCKTGSIGFSRNLAFGEIAEQFIFLRNACAKKTDTEKEHPVDNIVIMGMGEPLLNLLNLRKAIGFFCDPAGMNFSRRRITVSTCGICEGLFDLAENGPYVKLAFSLVTADEQLRLKLMPGTKTNPLLKVKESLILFQQNSGSRITLEIPLLGGVNTRDKDILSVIDFAKGIDSVINVIPWNPVYGLTFEEKPLREPDKKEIDNYIKKLEDSGLNVTIRRRKGRGVMGACGQLGEQS